MMRSHAIGVEEMAENLLLLMPQTFKSISAAKTRENSYVGLKVSAECCFTSLRDVRNKRFHISSALHSMLLAIIKMRPISRLHLFLTHCLS